MSHRSYRFTAAWLVGILVAGLLATASAEIPRKINYQGRLTDGVTGAPLEGEQSMTFRIYDASIAGAELWSETQTVTPDSLGVISVILGATKPIDIPFDNPVWLEVQVESEILSPRREIVSVPFAFYAANCDSLGGYSSSSYSLADHDHDDRYFQKDSLSTSGTINDASNPVDWTRLKNVPPSLADGVDDGEGDGHSLDADDGDPVDAVYVDSSGDVGVGTTNPQALLHVFDGSAGGGGLTGGAELVIEDDGNARISLLTPNDAYPGVTFGDPEDSEAGKIVYSHGEDHMRFVTNGASQVTIDSDGDVGIGTTTPDERLHVKGTVKAVASGDTARAVIGKATASGSTINYGGYFYAAGSLGRAIYAEGSSHGLYAKGNTAVYGESHDPLGFGVHAIANNGGTGVGGYANGDYSNGVKGYSNGTSLARGVCGVSGYNGSGNHAIHGDAGAYPNAYAGYFVGRVHVAGNLSKSGGEFLIDHPDDPENRILRHSFVESPEMLLIYKGRARLQDGVTTVELPSYFEALAHPEGREIVLTCVGGYSPLYLDGEIAEGRFTVCSAEGGAADQEFSWIVYGTRNDAWAQQHRLPVEEDKTPDGEFKVGEYLNPEAFGIDVQPLEPPAPMRTDGVRTGAPTR